MYYCRRYNIILSNILVPLSVYVHHVRLLHIKAGDYALLYDLPDDSINRPGVCTRLTCPQYLQHTEVPRGVPP